MGESEEEMVDDWRPAKGRVVRDQTTKVNLRDLGELSDGEGSVSVLTLQREK